MESDRPLPLIEAALERLRTKGILAPNMIHIERPALNVPARPGIVSDSEELRAALYP
jgi:hypothetical protein